MVKYGIGGLLLLVFILVFLLAGLWMIFGSSTMVVILSLIIVFFIVVTLFVISKRAMTLSESLPQAKLDYKLMDDPKTKDGYSRSQKKTNSDFDIILKRIRSEFNPSMVKDEDDLERQFIDFLNVKFPDRMQVRGHTSSGRKVDVVIDGTYSIECKIASNEAELTLLITDIDNEIMEFGGVAIVLYDVGKIPESKIQEYIKRYKEMGVETIVKKGSVINTDDEEKK